MPEIEVPLTGGNVAAAVVRVGSTVRKPVTAATPAVEAVLQHLEDVGFEGAPRALGRDSRGRQVLEYVDGPVAHDLPEPLPLGQLARVGRLVRDLHDALEDFRPPPDSAWETAIRPDRHDLICHHDLAPWNLVLGERWVFIDWDGAGPGSRLWDLAYSAQTFVPLQHGGRPQLDGPRLSAVVDGYGLDDSDRRQLPALLGRRTRAMHDLLLDGARTGREPWARLYAEGHAAHWGPAAAYVTRHTAEWTAAISRQGRRTP